MMRWIAGFVLMGLLLPVVPAAAQGMMVIQQERQIAPGRLIPPVLPLKSQRVNLRVAGGVIQAEVEQVFNNPHSFQAEGTYLFVLPEGATVSRFRMQVGSEPVEGRILTAEEARRIYESYVRRAVDPGILEYAGRTTYRARVFPIEPNSDKAIQIGYSQPAAFQSGVYRVHFPLKYDAVMRLGGVVPLDGPEPAATRAPQPVARPIESLTLTVNLQSPVPLRAIYSPTHEIQVRRTDEHRAVVTFEAKNVVPDRDFQLYYTVSESEFGANLLATRRPGSDGYFLLMLAPQRQVDATRVQPKDLVFVFDTSGSMQGAKIEQARRALSTVVDALNPQDRFHIIRFSSEVTSFRPGLVPATPENRQAAQQFIAEFRAVGGTAIYDALDAAMNVLANEQDPARSRYVIFMTDGLPTVGETNVGRIIDNVRQRNAGRARVFVFGVGDDVNTLLLDRIARDNGGDSDYVSANEDLEAKVGSFYAKIAHPVLANLRLEAPGAQLYDLEPARLPDLFAGNQLLVVGRFKGTGKQTLALTGEFQGQPRRYTYEVTLPEREAENGFIPKLWANRRIAALLEQIRIQGESKELKDEVVRLSLEFGIVTPYTSFLVEEPNAAPPRPVPMLRPDAAGAGGFGGAGAPAAPGAAVRARREALAENVGRQAVAASRALRELQQRGVADTDVELQREVAGRLFRWERGAWRDTTVPANARTVKIAYGSDAYFAVLRTYPQWTRFLALGRSLTLRTGRTTVLVIGETGAKTLTPAQLRSLTR